MRGWLRFNTEATTLQRRCSQTPFPGPQPSGPTGRAAGAASDLCGLFVLDLYWICTATHAHTWPQVPPQITSGTTHKVLDKAPTARCMNCQWTALRHPGSHWTPSTPPCDCQLGALVFLGARFQGLKSMARHDGDVPMCWVGLRRCLWCVQTGGAFEPSGGGCWRPVWWFNMLHTKRQIWAIGNLQEQPQAAGWPA